MKYPYRHLVWLCLFVLAGCAESTSSSGTGGTAGAGGTGVADPDYTTRGPSIVGVLTTSVTDDARSRTLPVEVWYPIATAGTPSEVIDFEQGERRADLAPLLDAAPDECVAKTTGATRYAPAETGEYPIVLYTHCYTCTRWSAHAVIERLVSHGFVVVSADHEGDTLYDALEGTQSALSNELVDVREADVRVLLDRVLMGEVLPEGVSAISSQVGLLGHSIGSVTAGRVAQNDERIVAVLGMAAPMENILYGEVMMENIDIPVGMLKATEDNSIGTIGNAFIDENFGAANTPAYKLDIVDAGHWSVTNIAGLTDGFAPGCGDGERQTDGEPFTYVPVSDANDFTATFASAFFAGHVLGEPSGLELLRSNPWPSEAPISVRE